jgi:uncharacterized membrane protein YjgN (DUF898 family)
MNDTALVGFDVTRPPRAARAAATLSTSTATHRSGASGATRQAAPGPEILGPQRFKFTGTGAEYFRIWLVNLLLSIVTLGVYSAWAKVRRLQYFYRNTSVAGAIFDYHGNPKAILKGRVLALALLGAYKMAVGFSLAAAAAIGLALLCLLPWLLARSFHFKLVNSTYRGLHFHFRGTAGDAYRTLIMFPIVFAVTGFFLWSVVTSFAQRPSIGVILLSGLLPLLVLGGTVPLAHYLLKRYQHDHGYFGQSPFFFHARAGGFFKTYAKALGFIVIGAIVAGIFGAMTARMQLFLRATSFGWLFGLLFGLASAYAFYLFVRPYLESRLQNLIWNQTELADHKFRSTASARHLLWIHASNLALISLTLGLYKPFATIRLIKYRVEQMSLMPQGDLEEFLSDQSRASAGAMGQEVGDLFNIDIAL